MDDKEKRILKSAREHFVQFGFKKTSLDDIIRVAQVGKGTVYKFFKNKEDLFQCMAEVMYEKMYAHLQSAIVSESNPEEKLLLYVRLRIRYTREYFLVKGSNMMVFSELKAVYNQISPNNSREVAILSEIMNLGERREVFKQGNSQSNARLISQIINRFETRWCQMSIEEAESEINELMTLVLEGVKA
jgi:AcrR family transcriptional regulator